MLGIVLPPLSKPAANYVSTKRWGNLLFVSGQVSQQDGRAAYIGRLGAELSISEGHEAAQSAALSLMSHLAAIDQSPGNHIVGIVKLTVYVAATPEFCDHPAVADGASDLLTMIFGEAGVHSRAAIGVCSLPRGVAIEIDAIAEIAQQRDDSPDPIS